MWSPPRVLEVPLERIGQDLRHLCRIKRRQSKHTSCSRCHESKITSYFSFCFSSEAFICEFCCFSGNGTTGNFERAQLERTVLQHRCFTEQPERYPEDNKTPNKRDRVSMIECMTLLTCPSAAHDLVSEAPPALFEVGARSPPVSGRNGHLATPLCAPNPT